MKLVTLNIWQGRVKDAYPAFFAKHSEVDIWLFQEVHSSRKDGVYEIQVSGKEIDYSLLQTLSGYLPEHKYHFCQVLQDYYGIAAFLREGIEIADYGEILISRGDWDQTDDLENKDHHRKLQWLEVRHTGKKLLLMNAHLTHRPYGKGDSEKRINQSQMIVNLIKMFDGPKILAGDFNLMPDTESIKMIEAAGMINLVKEYKVSSTRTPLYTKPFPYADYIFVSPDIEVKDFKVLPDVVSDHSPLYLEFE